MKKLCLLLTTVLLLLAADASGQGEPQQRQEQQQQQRRIGRIEFFGYAGLDTNAVRAALPFREGDQFDVETGEEKVGQAREAVRPFRRRRYRLPKGFEDLQVTLRHGRANQARQSVCRGPVIQA